MTRHAITDWMLVIIFGLVIIGLSLGTGLMAGQRYVSNVTNATIEKLEKRLENVIDKYELNILELQQHNKKLANTINELAKKREELKRSFNYNY